MEKAKHDKAEAAIPRGETTQVEPSARASRPRARQSPPTNVRQSMRPFASALSKRASTRNARSSSPTFSTEREVARETSSCAPSPTEARRAASLRSGTREMSWHLVKGLDGLATSSFGIEEPPMKTTPSSAPTRSSTPERSPSSLRSPSTKPACASGTEEVSTTRSPLLPGTTVGLCRESHLLESLAARGLSKSTTAR